MVKRRRGFVKGWGVIPDTGAGRFHKESAKVIEEREKRFQIDEELKKEKE
ncbi:hypothetical protein HOC01_00695 [archaeon]|jgi:hypothetical protein|nr:hypothetical protein [archaeon]MBT6698641.1 hypothetical protein [archaeon]